MAEKQRRDNLNTNISRIAALIPAVAGSSKRLDKISILRMGATFLRTDYVLGTGNKLFLPRKFKVAFEKFLYETLVGSDGFIIVLTSTGKIVYIGQQVEQCLGHAQADLLGQSVYNYVDPNDHDQLAKSLVPEEDKDRLTLTERTSEENSNCSEDSRSSGNSSFPFNEERRSFNIRMTQRAASRRDNAQYACLNVSGLLRPADACRKATSGGVRIKAPHELNSNDIIFVGIARLIKRRITELSLLDASKEEYVTRHLVDGRIIYCDHRISLVAGYMTNEVSGTCAFEYMHQDDAIYTIAALRHMYSRGEDFGTSCYRLKTKTGKFIYLQTHAYIEIDHERRSFQSFVCINSSVSEEEGEKLSRAMKRRLSATMSSPNSPPEIVMMASLQLEDAVRHLLSDMEAPPAPEDYSSSIAAPDEQSMKAVCVSQHLPPPSIHANEIGVKCIDRPLPSSHKGKNIKRECDVGSPASTHSQQTDDSNFEESGKHGSLKTSTVNPRRGEKRVPDTVVSKDEMQFHSQSSTPAASYSHRDDKCYKTDASSSSIASEDCNESPNTETTSASINVCPRIEETAFRPVKMEMLDFGHPEIVERSKNPPINKRSNADDSILSNKKKRRGSKNISSSIKISMNRIDDDSLSYERNNAPCVPFVNYKEERIVEDQPRFNIDPHQPLGNPINIDESIIDCSTLNPNNVEFTGYDDDFPDLQNDPLLSLGLTENTDFMKIFEDSGSDIGFEKNFDDRTIPEFPNNEQAVNEVLTRTHIELGNRMTMQHNRLSVLEQQLEMPTGNPQPYKSRAAWRELMAESTKNTQMLKRIQKDLRNNIQTSSMKQNIGV